MNLHKMNECLRGESIERIYRYLSKGRNKDYISVADNIMKNKCFLVPPFTHSINGKIVDEWDNEERYSRSLLRLLNGFSFIGDLISAFIDTNNESYIIKGFEIFEEWMEFKDYSIHKNSMLFHDETTAMRMEYLLSLAIKGKGIVKGEKIDRLLTELEFTASLLVDEKFHAKNTNHGMFQDLALLKYGIIFNKLDEAQSYIEISNRRLVEYFEMIYTSEGIHKEHSPAYHLMVTTNLKRYVNLLRDCNIESPLITDIDTLLLMAEKYIIYITRPDGCIPNISDTEKRKLRDSYPNLFNSDEYKFVLSEGKEGKQPEEKNIVFKETGYAIFRDGWDNGSKNSQVIFTASYNVGYHKHTDDLNVLFYCGEDILVEAGPNGYNYKDPFTKYAYSANAHNTLNVVNKPLPRHDEKYDKVKIIDYRIDDKCSEVTGINERYEGITHERKIKYFNNKNILEVEDNIRSEEINNYLLNWHIAKGLDLKEAEYGFDIFKLDKKIGIIKINSNVPYNSKVINGRENRSPQGWYFDKMEGKTPINNIEISFQSRNAKFNTQVIIFKGDEKEYENEIYYKEKIFIGEKRVKYLFKENSESKKLCIIFSAMGEKNKFVYNYINTLKDCKVNQLYILDDFDIQGSYYLSKPNKNDVEDSVRNLIFSIVKEKGILLEDIIAIGSSKGGYSSLYYGIKYNFGNIIAGAPQSKLGDFLIDQAKHYEVAEYISGGRSEQQKRYLNNILFNTLENNSNSSAQIYIHVGEGDYHYKKHIIPLCEELDILNLKYVLDVEDYKTHAETKIFFPVYLKKTLNRIDKNIIDINDIEEIEKDKLVVTNVKVEQDEKVITSTVEYNYIHDESEMDKSLLYAYYVYKDDVCIHKEKYSKNNQFLYRAEAPGNYRIRGYIKNNEGKVSSKNSKIINIR